MLRRAPQLHRPRNRAPFAGRVFVLLALGLLTLGFARDASAQLRDLGERMNRVEVELGRTDEMIEKVKEQVREADVARVNNLISLAEETQFRAEQTFRQVTGEMPVLSAVAHLRQSLSMTLRARDFAQRAGRQLHEQVSQQEGARRALERAADLFDSLRGPVADSGNRQAVEILNQARRKMELAEAQLRDGNFEVALNLAENALRMMQNLKNEGRDSYAERAAEEIARTRLLLERAQERFEGAEGAEATQLARAEGLLQRAQTSLENGRIRVVRRQIEECREILRKLMAQSGAEVDPATVQRGIERIDADLERLRDGLGRNLPAAVREQIDRIVGERNRAAQALRAGNTETAVRHLRAASDLLARLQRRLDGDSN